MLAVAHTTHSIQLFTRNPIEKKDKASASAWYQYVLGLYLGLIHRIYGTCIDVNGSGSY